jgi:methyl-accepting chemotaxis protein
MQLARIEILKDIEDAVADDYTDIVLTIKEHADTKFHGILVITSLIIVLALAFNYLMLVGITQPLTRVVTISQAIANGHLENEIEEDRRDEIGQLLSAFKQMQTRLRDRILEDKRITEEALRINQALNNVTTGVLIADDQNKIIYANRSAEHLFAEVEETIHKIIPGFQTHHLVGLPIDVFQRRSEQQFDFSDDTKTIQRLLITVGHLKLDASLAPVVNTENQRLGWVTELRDRTAEIATEQEVDTVISAAAQGNFEKRIDLTNKTGFFYKLGEMLNQNLDYNHQIVEELMGVFSAIARGDLTKSMTNNYVGSLEQLKEDVNATVYTLTQVMNEIKQTADAASEGNFNQRIELSDKHGFFRTLSETLNQILDYNRLMVEELRQVFSAIAKGDLTQTITKDYQGTLALLKDDVNITVAKLIEVMNTVKQAAETVSHAAGEISQGNTNLSQRTEQQSASLEETAASMEQMTGTVQQSANNTRKASELANTTSRQAQQGSEVVNSAVTAMKGINETSKRVADIISVIDNIAFQTNLLALNAAVEAARAGDQGRGFAVVANEVRQLAQRSALSAKEIKELIEESLNKVEKGTMLVNNSGNVFKEIMVAIESVTVINSEIAAAGQEQLAGIHQVNKAVNQMEEMTQQNASLVEEATASSEQMQEQAENLKRHVAFFKTGQSYTSAVSAPKTFVSTKTPRKGNSSKSSTDNNSSGWEDF